MNNNKVIYYYCQGFNIDPEDELELKVTLATKNFDNFMIIAKKYGRMYFPDHALIRDKDNNVIGKINVYYPEGFKLINEFRQEN